MSASLTVFTYWLLVASWQMGVRMLPVVVDDDVAEWAWAATCYRCEPPQYEVNVAKNGRRVGVRDLSRSEWCSIYDDA